MKTTYLWSAPAQRAGERYRRTFDRPELSDARIVRPNVDDTPYMLRLAEITEPGPFNSRTNELGYFFGIREGGQLVAMAGERLTAGKYVEISAVCTHQEWPGGWIDC